MAKYRVEAIRAGDEGFKNIQFIKDVRGLLDWGLKDAKLAVDAINVRHENYAGAGGKPIVLAETDNYNYASTMGHLLADAHWGVTFQLVSVTETATQIQAN